MHRLERISYVEDEPDIRAVTELALTQLGGFDLDVSIDGIDAMTRIPNFAPDLILMDVMMPGMSGPEVFLALSDMPEHATTPVIFMTAKAQTHEVAEYYKLGAAGVIAKPFDPLTLCEQIRGIWQGAGQ